MMVATAAVGRVGTLDGRMVQTAGCCYCSQELQVVYWVRLFHVCQLNAFPVVQCCHVQDWIRYPVKALVSIENPCACCHLQHCCSVVQVKLVLTSGLPALVLLG